jgi:hypothetical protein
VEACAVGEFLLAQVSSQSQAAQGSSESLEICIWHAPTVAGIDPALYT